jgi:aspartate aminotransferase
MYSLDGIDDNVILIDSVSKRYSMCGARVGALITRNVQVREAALKFAQARLSPPTFGQIAAEAALETPQSYFDDVTREYVTRRDFTVSELNKIPGVFCPMPSGAFYCIAKLPIDNSDKFCQWLLESFSIANTTIMLAPATGFYISRGLGAQEVRIAYVLNKKDLATAINILAKALEVYPGRVAETSDILSSSL